MGGWGKAHYKEIQNLNFSPCFSTGNDTGWTYGKRVELRTVYRTAVFNL